VPENVTGSVTTRELVLGEVTTGAAGLSLSTVTFCELDSSEGPPMPCMDWCAVTVYGPPVGALMLHDQYELTATEVQPCPPDPFTITLTVAPVSAPPDTMPGVTKLPGPSSVGAPSTFTVTDALLVVASALVSVAVSTIPEPFGTWSTTHDHGEAVVRATVQSAPPGAVTTTVLPASAVPVTVNELLPRNWPAVGAEIVVALAWISSGAAAAPCAPSDSAASSAEAATPAIAMPRSPRRRTPFAPRSRNERLDALVCGGCTVLSI
jgi:hypothetical protein